MTLPFDQKIDIPLSAICEYGTLDIQGHRVKVITFGRKKERRMICAKCKKQIVHEVSISAYVTPFTIEEEPEIW